MRHYTKWFQGMGVATKFVKLEPPIWEFIRSESGMLPVYVYCLARMITINATWHDPWSHPWPWPESVYLWVSVTCLLPIMGVGWESSDDGNTEPALWQRGGNKKADKKWAVNHQLRNTSSQHNTECLLPDRITVELLCMGCGLYQSSKPNQWCSEWYQALKIRKCLVF